MLQLLKDIVTFCLVHFLLQDLLSGNSLYCQHRRRQNDDVEYILRLRFITSYLVFPVAVMVSMIFVVGKLCYTIKSFLNKSEEFLTTNAVGSLKLSETLILGTCPGALFWMGFVIM